MRAPPRRAPSPSPARSRSPAGHRARGRAPEGRLPPRDRGSRDRGRARLRRPVLAADRPPDPRLRGLQRAPRPRHPRRADPRPTSPRDRAVGWSRVGIRRGRTPAGPRAAGAGCAGDRHLLRHAAARTLPRWARRAGRGRASSAARSCSSATGGCCWEGCRPSRPAGCPTATPSSSPLRDSPPWPPRRAPR